jgi:hypothetical protein
MRKMERGGERRGERGERRGREEREERGGEEWESTSPKAPLPIIFMVSKLSAEIFARRKRIYLCGVKRGNEGGMRRRRRNEKETGEGEGEGGKEEDGNEEEERK